MAEGGQTAVEADEDVVGASKFEISKRKCASWSACSGRRPWKSKSCKEALDAARAKKPTLPLVSWNEDGSR